MEFVEATLSDIQECLDMIQDFYLLDNYPFSRERASGNFKELTRNEHLGKFWLIKIDDSTIGYMILTFGYSFEYGGRDAFIDELYLKEDSRGKGYGKQVLSDLEKLAKPYGVHAIHLEVEKTNEAGNQLYFKSGFKGNNRSLLTKRLS